MLAGMAEDTHKVPLSLHDHDILPDYDEPRVRQ
jgi:hypothetical protein